MTEKGARVATRQKRLPEAWLAAVEARGHGTEERLPVTSDERLVELMMMGLRLGEGIARARFLAETGRDIEATLPARRVADLVDGGFLVIDAAGIRATDAGRQRLNAVLAALLG